jgi:DNA-directed RNA polymerase subunit RPC12/RpoP
LSQLIARAIRFFAVFRKYCAEEGKDLIKEAEGETKTGISVDAVSVTVKGGLGLGPRECPSCGRYITEPLVTRDSKNDALVMVCPYCGNRI